MRLREQGVTKNKYKRKTTPANLGMFLHILAYSVIIRHNYAYSVIFQAYSGIFRTPAYSKSEKYSSVKTFCPAHNLRMKCISKTS